MGFQSNINQMLGASAAAAVAISGEKEKKEKALEAEKEKAAKDKEQGLLAASQSKEAESAIKELNMQKEDKANEIKGIEAEMKGFKDTDKMEAGSMEQLNEYFHQKQVMSEKEAADKAFQVLQDKIDAKKAVVSRAEAIMKRTGTWGGMR